MDNRKCVVNTVIREIDEENRIIKFTASTEQVARDGDIILVSAWDLENFEKNPVFLWAHDGSSLPIGRVTAIKKITRGKNKRLDIDVEFAGMDQLHEHAEAVFRLYRDGFLNAVSVGYRALKIKDITDDERKTLGLSQWGWLVEKAELYEVSAVPMPSDTGALKKGADEDMLAVRGLLSDEDAVLWDERVAAISSDDDKTSGGISTSSDPTTTERDSTIADLKGEVERLQGELDALVDEDDLDEEVRDVDDLDEEVERDVSNLAPSALIDDLDDPYDISSEIEARKKTE